jgi:hypothetical protein
MTSRAQLENIARTKEESFLDPDCPIGIPRVGYPLDGPSIPAYFKRKYEKGGRDARYYGLHWVLFGPAG